VTYNEHPDYIGTLGRAVNRVMSNINCTTTTLSLIDSQALTGGESGGVAFSLVVGDNFFGLPAGVLPTSIAIGEVIGNMKEDGSCEVWDTVQTEAEISATIADAEKALSVEIFATRDR
jgi:hypothetical protein